MTVRFRRWRLVALAIIGALMSAHIAAEGIGRWVSNRGVDIVLAALGSQQSEFLADRAQRFFELRDYATAERVAREAVGGAPLNQKAVRVLGMAQIAQGNSRGNETLRAAGELGWQDVPTQAWLMLDSLQRGDAQAAMFRADALARRAGMRPELLQVIVAFARDDTTLPLLLERLELNPMWRHEFFALASNANPTEVESLALLLRRLEEGPAPPTREEIAPVVRRLVELAAYDQAEALATDLLRQSMSSEEEGLLGDGEFALPELYRARAQERTPFDWEIGSARGATAMVSDFRGGSEGGVLFVDSNGAERTVLATKMIRIPPGPYRLGYSIESEDSAAFRRFQWSVVCMPGGETLTPEAEGALVPGESKRIELPFVVPPSGCEAQAVRLQAGFESPRNTVTAQFDDIEIRTGS